MASEDFKYFGYTIPEYGNFTVEKDKYTSDADVSQKLRSVNLIKYNPELFRVRKDTLYDVLGGHKSLVTTLSFTALFVLFRKRACHLRGISQRQGVWKSYFFGTIGFFTGGFYSSLFFMKTQVFLNDYVALFLTKRYKDSKNLNTKDIYRLKDKECELDEYHHSSSFFKTFHIDVKQL